MSNNETPIIAEEAMKKLGKGYSWFDNVSRDLFPDSLQGLVSVADKINNFVIKPVVRESLALSIDAGTLLEWSLGELYADTRDQITGKAKFGRTSDESKERFKSFSDQFITTQRDGLQGLGTGFLPGGEATQSAMEGIQKARPRVGSHSFTLGRAAAYPLVQLGKIDEDSLSHQLISGSIDAYKVVKNPFDPFNQIARIRPGGTGAESVVGVGKTNAVKSKEFIENFETLENKVINLRDNLTSPTGRTYTPQEQALIDNYNLLTSPVAPSRTKPYAQGSLNFGAVADTYEPSTIYKHWRPLLDDAFNDATNQAGLINDLAPTFIRNQFQTWKQSGKGTAWAQDLIDNIKSGELDTQTLWKSPMFGREGIGTVSRLVEAAQNPNFVMTTDDVFSILDNAMQDFNPLYNVRKLGMGKIDAVRTNSGLIVKTQAQKYGVRQLEIFPENLRIGFNDPNQSARNLDDIMGLYNFNYADRNFWLTEWARASKGSKDDIFQYLNDFEEQAVRTKLQELTVPGTNILVFDKKMIREITSWSRKVADEAMSYTIDDVAANVPLQWIDGNGIAPLRISQLLANDYYITPPQFVQQVIEATGTIGAYRLALEQAPIIGKPMRGVDQAGEVLRAYMSRIWKPSRVAKVSHLIRVVPEEVARAAASGIFEHPMEQMFAMLGRTMQTDALGNVISRKQNNLIKINTSLAEVQMTLIEANSYLDNLNKGIPITKRQQQLVDRIPQLEKKIAEFEEQLIAKPQAIIDAMIGTRSRGAQAMATGEYKDVLANQFQRGVLQLPDRVADPIGWNKGMIHEIADMARNGDYQKIAARELFSTDRIVINGVDQTLANHIANNAIHPYTKQPLRNDLDAVKLWLFQGRGREFFESYFDDVANLKSQYKNRGWDNYATASERVDTILDKDIAFLTGLDKQLLEVVATGNFRGVKATSFDPFTGRGKASVELEEYIGQTFIKSPHAPNRVRNFVNPSLSTPRQGLNFISNGMNKLFDFYFTDMYGKASDLASRSPVWRAGYWTRMEELASSMTPSEAKKLLDAAKKANITSTRLERIELQTALANGKGTVEGAQLLAESFARRFSNDLLFNANKKSLFGQQHWILFPFFEAFREVTGTWLKLSSQNPRIIRNVGQVVGTAQEEGWFYTDLNGRKVFELPMTAALARIFAGTKNSVINNFTVGVNAVNIAGQMRPGFGPVVQIAGTFLPKSAEFDWLRKAISPFGQPDTLDISLQGLFVPAYIKQAAARTQKGENIFGALSKAVLGNVREDDYYLRAYSRITQYLASSNENLYLGTDGTKRLFEDAENMTFKIVEMRGLTAFLGPGAPMTNWLANTKYGTVEVGIIMDDLYNKELAATNAGEPSYKGFNAWLDQWGESIWPYVTSLTESTIGGQIATTEYQNWTKDNGYILKKYPTVAGFFGPRTGERNFDAYNQQVNVNTRNVADPKKNIAEAQNNLGNYLYYKLVDSIPPEQINSTTARQAKADAIEQIEKNLPGWQRPGSKIKARQAETRSKIAELRSITNDPKLQELPITKAVSDYLTFRDQAVASAIKANKTVTKTNWTESNAGKDVRIYLSTVVAPQLIATVPDFKDVYERVLAYEFIVDED